MNQQLIYCGNCLYTLRQSLTPSITSISAGQVRSGDTLTASLDTLDPANSGNVDCTEITMFIGDVNCPVSSCDAGSNTVSCVVPGVPDDIYRIRVNFARFGDASHGVPGGHDVEVLFAIDDITPLAGSFGGGTTVTITGSGFGQDTFNGEVCGEPLEECDFSGDGQQVTCKTPNIGSAQNCEFLFYNAAGELHNFVRSGFNFDFDPSLTPFIDSVNPKMGGSMGGTRITISGSGFVPGSQSVSIGASPCLIQSETAIEIVCETEPHPISTKHRVIVSINGQGNAAADDGQFWYIDRWSSVFTWGCNDTNVVCENKPVADDIAVIPKGTTILLDETTPVLSVTSFKIFSLFDE